MRILALFGIALFLTACGRDSDKAVVTSKSTPRWSSFPVGLYVDASLQNDAAAMQDIEYGLQFWNQRAGKTLFQIDGPLPNGFVPFESTGTIDDTSKILSNAIFFHTPWSLSADKAAHTVLLSANFNAPTGGIIGLNSSYSYCYGICSDSAQMIGKISFRRLIAHELGHLIGLSHVDDSANILYPQLLPSGDIDSLTHDDAALRNLL